MSETETIQQLSKTLDPIPTGMEPKLEKLPGIKAVLFDIYGTLLISGTGDVGSADPAGKAEAMRQALEEAGFGLRGDYVAEEALAGLKTTIGFVHEKIKEQGGDYPEVDILKVWTAVTGMLTTRQILQPSEAEDAIRTLALQYECLSNPTWEMPGARELLKDLTEQGLTLGIVSNAQFYTPFVLEAHLGASVEALGFDPDLCVWSYELLRAKPSKAMFPPCLNRLAEQGIEPAEILYVGNDLLNDVATAGAAGCKTTLFAGDQRSLRMREGDPRVDGVVPDAVVTSLEQVGELL